MTDHDLATLLREHVSAEPPYDQGADVVLHRGRSTVRRTRSVAALGTAAALALAAAVVVPRVWDGGAGTDRVVDPAVADALADYDASTMPAAMDDRARAVIEPFVPDLGGADFVAFDSQLQKLPEQYWAKASGLTLRYGEDSGHRFVVTLSHSRGEAEGDPDRYCTGGLDAGYSLECTVDRTAGGDTVITMLGAKKLMRQGGAGLQGWQDQFMAVTADDLSSTPADRLWFARDVKVIRSETFVTWTSEMVQAPDVETARERLVVPPAELAALGLDPALVMPTPPPGENGCPQWTMPTMDVSCSG